MDIEKLRREFRNPGNEYRFAPFWFWNHELEDEELRWQIQEMCEKGVGGFIMHPRHGLLTPYLSKEWMERIETAIKEAERLQMKAYLYDENNWPSGPADAKVIEENPEFRMSGVYLSDEFKVKGPKKLEEIVDIGDELVAVIAVPAKGEEFVDFPESALNITPCVCGCQLSWEVPRGEWKIFAFARKYLVGMFFGSYLDTMNKDAVKRFIELTHQAYAERFSQYFGSVVRGIFTDEPAMNHMPANFIPWTPTMPSEFEWRYGYDLLTALPALFREAGPQTPKIRCDFYDTATYLYQQAYFKQIYEFCDPLRLNTIGHVNAEGEMYYHIHCQGDFFAGAQYMHFGGVDQLCELTWPEVIGGHNNLLGPKFASSAAHLLEKPVVMSECFGLASQWGINLRTLKWLADWQIALGVNLLEPHAFYYSIQGYRKWECPPDEFYRMPFWSYYRKLSDYTSRLCALFTGGQHIADVALLYPAKSMWASINPTTNSVADKIIAGFDKISRALLRGNFDFDILAEEMLQDADFTEGTIGIWGENLGLLEEYKILVMPTLTTISSETAEAIRDFYEEGGKIVACGTLPTNSTERGQDMEMAEYLAEIFGVKAEEAALKTDKPGKVKIYRKKNDIGGEAIFIANLHEAEESEVTETLYSVLNELIEPDVKVTKEGKYIGDIIHLHYLQDETHFFLFVNTSRSQSHCAEITLDIEGNPQIWDAQTGETKPLTCYNIKEGKLCLRLTFEPTQSYVISVAPEEHKDCLHVTDANLEIVDLNERAVKGIVTQEGKYWVEICCKGKSKRFEANVKRLPKEIKLANQWDFKADKLNALPLREWNYKMEARVTGRDSCNGWHTYETTFIADYKPTKARILVDGLVIEKVWRGSARVDAQFFLNGERITDFKKGEYLDHYILEAEVAGLIKEGENKLIVRTEGHLYEIPNLGHPIVLVGDFQLQEKEGKYVLDKPAKKIKTGSWTEQGYPHYSGIGTYEQTIEIPKEYLNNILRLRLENVADLADVWVNGKQAGVCAWEPFEIDISDLVKPGKNTITIKVANSMQNLLLEDIKPSGLLGEVKIVPRAKVEFKIAK